MDIQIDDTVKLIAPFGLDKNNQVISPDYHDLGKYGKVTGKEKNIFNVTLFDGGYEYGVVKSQLEKITFFIVDEHGKKLRGKYTLESASAKLDELIKSSEGYWFVYGSDDNDVAWIEGG
jgi:hypothetical protein